VVGDAAALQLVVVEHGLAGGGDRDQPEAAAVTANVSVTSAW